MADITKVGSASVQLATNTTGATIHYTDDGSNPSTSSPQYSAAIAIYKNKTIKAVAVKSGLLDSVVSTLSIDIKLATPELSVTESGVDNIVKVTNVADYSNNGTVTFRYTTDGNDPTEQSTAMDDPSTGITIEGSKTVKVKAFATDNVASDVATTSIVETLPTPVLEKAAGTASDNCTVSVSNLSAFSAYEGYEIRYTTNGNEPTQSDTLYSGAISLTANGTIKAKAFCTGYTTSATGSVTVSDLQVQAVTITVEGESVSETLEVEYSATNYISTVTTSFPIDTADDAYLYDYYLTMKDRGSQIVILNDAKLVAPDVDEDVNFVAMTDTASIDTAKVILYIGRAGDSSSPFIPRTMMFTPVANNLTEIELNEDTVLEFTLRIVPKA